MADKVPAYVSYWVGKRVVWPANKPKHEGLCIDAGEHREESERVVRLRVVRDDGFIEVGLDADTARRIQEETAQ